MKNTKSNISVSKRSRILIIVGFLFFVNPVPLGLDLIPDCIGCALLFFGLTQLAYFDGMVEQARKSLIYLFVTEFIKLLFTRSVFLTEISSNRMLAVTCFSLVEGIIYIIFFKNLFGGLSYFSFRNNCNTAVKIIDGTEFLSYLAFFTRIAATFIPELFAILELELNDVEDFDTYDLIADFLTSKIVFVVFLSVVAFVINVVWFNSMNKLIKVINAESGEYLDSRYETEVSSSIEITRPKRLKAASYAVYFALFFAIDIAFDNARVIPAEAMFLVLFISVFFFKPLYNFKNTKRFAIPAFVLLFGAELFRSTFAPNGAVVIYETELWIIAANALIALATVPMCLVCIRGFLLDIKGLSVALGGSEVPITGAWISYCISLVLWTAGFVVPYFYPFISTARFFASCVFIWQTARLLVLINDQERERWIYKAK